MLESVVADLLNRFLGDYVQDLDRSQLSLGIWGGNVALENLRIRENVLSELDVPFKVKYGLIEKLTLKIPWKNLYGDAVVATLEGLYLLVVPGASIKYDAEKEERNLQEAKQRELHRIEEALQKAAQKGKEKEEKKDTFLEKLAAQIIKNLQVKITNIHIRYEDDITDANFPISVGLTLAELSLQTCNERWVPCILHEASKVIYKMVRLDSLSTYWNVSSKMFYRKPPEAIIGMLKSNVVSGTRKPADYQYIFKPISASAKLYINPDAEIEQKTAKFDCNMEVQHVAIELTKSQYLSMIDSLESVDYMVRNVPYRKYRPNVRVEQDCRQWWNYAITSILEVHIKRGTSMWSWRNIAKHRRKLKAYKNTYKVKLTQTKLPEDTVMRLQALENKLDVFNIVLARQQAQAEVVRSGQNVLAKKAAGEKKSGGWFGGFWGGRKDTSTKKEDSEELSVPEKIDDLMTPEEKKKLFTAIGYSESSHNLALHKSYVAHKLGFKLVSTSITIREDANAPETLKIQIIDLSTKVLQRPGAQALRVEAKLDHWYVTGLRQQNIVPSLVSSIASSESSLLKIQYETNPENSSADQVLRLQSQPVEIIYDAGTINALADFFQTHRGMDLEQLTSATLMKLEEIKEKTSTGLTHIIQTRKVLDLQINLQPSFLLLPKSGFYRDKTDVIVVDFGNFQLTSINQGSLPALGTSSLEELMDKAYDKFHVQIKKVQMLFGTSGEDWKKARALNSSSLHILQPLDIDMQLGKSMVERDSRMPRFKVSGELPLLRLKISDRKMQGVFELVSSIPLPQQQALTPATMEKKRAPAPILSSRPQTLHKQDLKKSLFMGDESSDSDGDEFFDAKEVARRVPKKPSGKGSSPVAETAPEELTDLTLKFEVKEVLLELAKHHERGDRTVLAFRIQQLGIDACVKTFDLQAVSYLKTIRLDYYDVLGVCTQPLHLIKSSDNESQDLLKVEYTKAEKNGPRFQTTFENTEQALKVAFSSMELLLHSQALLFAVRFITEAVPSVPDKAPPPSAPKQDDHKETFVKKATKPSTDKDVVSFKVLAKLTSFSVNVWDERRHIAEIRILGLDSSVFMKSNEISVSARLQDLCVNDVSPQSLHKQAVCIMEEEVFNFNLMLYLEATQGEAYKDVSKVDGKVSLRVGCMKIVFLHKFIASLMEFLNNFQAAKEKVSAATAQAAQRAATSVKDLAERSFRLLMDIHLKAPVIVIPQSSVSNNAILADLGLIRIQNQFRLISSDRELAPIVDCMTISLTEFKLSRTVLNSAAAHPDIQILYPVNLSLAVNRNLAATWYHQIPGLEVKGHLNSMDVGLTQEDLNVLFSILMENLSEGEEGCGEREGSVQSESQTSSAGALQSAVPSLKHSDESSLEPGAVQSPAALGLLLGFEIKKVMIQLMKEARDSPLHVMQISQLRLETRLGIGGIAANVYLQNISLTCDDFKGADGGPLRLINSSNDGTEHLLEIKYVKADPHGPGFKTVHNNIVQRLEASMSSLNLILHTQALLSLVNFLSTAMPSQAAGEAEKTKELKSKVEQQKSVPTKPDTGHVGSAEEDIVDMKLSAKLNAFNVFVCDETCNIADIRIQGMDASYATQSGKQNLYARLRAIEVINVDPNTIHRKAIYILGDEVFNLQMTLYPDATQGAAYTDMSAVDGKISLKVGCIHIVCLYKFFMSLMNFMNTFQAAKEAVSSATAQAAEKAASSIQDLAQKSFRLAMDVSLKAPVIHVPQSSVSNNVVVADLGFINVRNKFMVVPNTGRPLPPVIDKMDISLTELKLLRTARQARSPQPELEILQPVNLNVSVQRNISSSWYSQIPTIQIDGKLKPMQVALSQTDLTVLMNILFENLSETPLLQPSTALKSEEVKAVIQETSAESKPQDETDILSFGSPESYSDDSSVVTLKFSFHFESLSIMLYNSTLGKASSAWLRHDNQRLGELRFHSLSSSGMMCADGSMDFSICLKTCMLDDLREGIARATSRIIDQKDPSGSSSMFDITYKQSREERVISAIIDKLYICVSVDFLMTVADFFTGTKPETRPNQDEDKPVQSQSKQSTPVKAKPDKGEQSAAQRLKVTAFIMDPEIVFVANLTKGEAPALAVSFQGNLILTDVSGKRKMTAIVKEFKVLACPFLRELRGTNITTVVQPCSLQLESSADGSGGQDVTLSVDEVIVKISPIILNTVLTIMAFLKAKPKEDVTQDKAVPVPDIWAVRTTDTCNSWFLGVEAADEVTECFLNPECTKEEETFNVRVKSVQVTLECGLGHRTVPLLLVESTFNGSVKNWTSLINVTADTTLEVHYYNEMFAVWEPLIERVDDGSRRWSLKLEMKNNPAMDKSLLPGDDFIAIPEPQTAISVTSKDTMNITVSKCTLGVFSNLSKAFSEGTASTYDYSFKDKAPLTVLNALGVPLTLQHGPNLRHFGFFTPDNIHKVAPGQSLELEFSGVLPLHCSRLSALHQQDSNLFTLDIEPEGYTQVGHIPITKPSRRLYNVRSPAEENCVSLVVQIDASEGNKVMFVRSPLQIKNHFSVPFTVYKFVAKAKLLEAVGVCKPDEEFHVPLHSYRCQLFLKPGGHLDGQFKESTSYIMWKEMLHRSSEVQCTLQCPATELHFLPFIVNCTAVPDEINFICSNGEKEWDPAYIIHLYPSLTIRNLVPYSLKYLLEGTADAHILSEGSSRDVLRSRISGEIMELTLIKYQGRNWNGRFRVHENLPEFFHVTFTVDTVEVLTVDLSVHVKRVGNRMILSVFSPYWIINKTGRILQYKADDIHVKHPSDYRDVILFSFKRKTIFSKNKVQLCISTSSWSSSFSLDTVGSYGCVKCPDGKMEYLVGVNITMSSFNLTRIITLTPFYMLVNNCALELEVGEIKADGSMPDMKWEYIGASECVPFWAENVSGKMCVRVVGSDNVSKPFFFNKQDNGTLLSLQRMNSGLMVDISISDRSIVIHFSEYYEGAAPALIMNHTTRATLAYGQSGTEEKMELHPGEARLFAWEDPTAIKTLSWIYSETKGEIDLLKDESGQFAYTKDIQVHWVSFLDGRQRILLFTEDVALVTKARQADEMEQPDQEITVSIHSLGLSLIDNESKQEISYIGITSSGIIWEFLPKLKWKPFSQKQILELEQAYVRHCGGESSRWVKIDSKFEVSFSSMDMRLPLQCKIRRSFLSGIHVEFKQSSHQRSVRAQLCWLQVDNQLPGSMFPAVFHPVAPPKSIALDSEPKPFIDVSIITRFNEFSKVLQFKYFMVLIQCMALKIDQGFLTAMVGLFTPMTPPDAGKQRNKLIQADLDKLSQELMESSMTDITTLSFFEHFHISPVKLHLSLSLGVGGKESKEEEQEIVAISSINLLLKSIGATLTDVDDVIFKLACFEARYQFYKWDQLRNLVIRHYSEQFLKQLYVLVLGLDVLGNPFGLIRGLSEGVEAFFYEPFQGAVQGPEEFAEGLVIGVRSLLGHTVGGAAGVVSRITGTVGKGLAAMTMDKEYQQKRREEMGRQPKDFGESLAKGGKGLLRGVVGGVTGIVTKPVEGAKKEGAAGFFKGIGKGLVGVVARPTGGIIDMASSTFQGIQRAAESTEEVSPLRSPRFIHEDGIIRPYVLSEAQGLDLFENSNLKKLEDESYRFCCTLDRKVKLVVTNRRVLAVKELEVFGNKVTDWDCLFEDFVSAPTVEENVLTLSIKDKGLLAFHTKEGRKHEIHRKIVLQNNAMAQEVLKVLDEARSTQQQKTLTKRKSHRFIREFSN